MFQLRLFFWPKLFLFSFRFTNLQDFWSTSLFVFFEGKTIFAWWALQFIFMVYFICMQPFLLNKEHVKHFWSHLQQFWPNLGSAVSKTFTFKAFKVLFFLQNLSALEILFETTYFWVFENQIGKAQGGKRSNFENIRLFNNFLCKVWGFYFLQAGTTLCK